MKTPAEDASAAKPAADQIVRVALLLRPRDADGLRAAVAALAGEAPQERRSWSREELTQSFGAAPEAVESVRTFAGQHGLEVVEVNAPGRLVVLQATVESLEKSFDCELVGMEAEGQTFHCPAQDVAVPAELREVVEAIFGFDNRPRFRRSSAESSLSHFSGGKAPPAAGSCEKPATPGGTSPEEVARRYNFPESGASGETIAVLLLGGGFYESDLREYFGEAMPRLEVVEVGGATNDPLAWADLVKAVKGQPPTHPSLYRKLMWTLEATVDVELIGSFAPGADIVVYFAPNTEMGKVEAFTRILTDPDHRPSVVSCSWGASEAGLDEEYVASVDGILQVAALSGVSVCYSSGDDGPQKVNGTPTVQYPGSSPHVLGCGGTTLIVADPAQPESAWRERRGPKTMATGGGFSRFFSRPAWQRGVLDAKAGDASQPGAWRGVPDVAGKADFGTGYDLVLGGVTKPFGGGTSSAAPMWAGLLARFNRDLGRRVGWITPLLYRPDLAASLNDVVHGTNGLFPAVPGWDASTGWGTPNGQALLQALQKA